MNNHLSTAFVLLFVLFGCAEQEDSAVVPALVNDASADVNAIYVMAGAPNGNGSKENPFGTLQHAQTNSTPGQTIYLLPSNQVLDGGISLKPGQKLKGTAEGEKVTMTNSTANQEGVSVILTTGNEVSGIDFVDLTNPGIHASALDGSGAIIADNSFRGSAAGEYDSNSATFAILFETASGEVADVWVTGNSISNGATMAGIHVLHQGTSSGSYHFDDNHFNNLPGRAYHLWSQDESTLTAEILNSSADNIGVGGQNSDSILPHVSGRSTMNMLVRNYQYNNTNQEGSPSNCGLEAFLVGPPFPGEALWCRGCSLDLTIEDSVFEDSVTDGIQLVNFGSNARLNVEIRRTQVLRAKPQQVGGGISLLAQNEQNQGSRTRLLIEDTDVIDSSGYGFALLDEGEGYTAMVDLGGGELGSKGNNRIVGSAEGELTVTQGNVVARHNWWGRADPRQELKGDRSHIVTDPVLSSDPRGAIR